MDIELVDTEMSRMIFKNNDYLLDDNGFRAVLEDHLLYLINRGELHPVDKSRAHRFNHDLASYLYDVRVPMGYHWLYMRCNNMTYNWEFDESLDYLIFPKHEDVDELMGQYAGIR